MASFEPNSHNCRGSLKDALTSLASFLWSSFPGTAHSSIHHSRVSHLSAFHRTHRPNSKTTGSRGIFSPSSFKVSSDPLRKEATVGFSYGSSSKSEPLPLGPSSLSSVLGSVQSGWGQVALQTRLGSASSFSPSLLGLLCNLYF